MATGDDRPRTGPGEWSAVSLASLASPVAAVDSKPPADRPRTTDPWIDRVVGGRFKLLERIGSGGMAVVYRAQEQGLIRRDVAIKLLTPESALSPAMLARFLKEAQVIADIHHPNVVQVIDVGRTDDGHLYLVMELLVGHTLHHEMQEVASRGEVFPWERAASISLQICGALQAAHRHKVVHRDIKPSNCFCIEVDGSTDFIKLLDFGIAKAQAGGSGDDLTTPLTQEGMFLGTPHYAAPEVITQDPEWPIDGRADIFAVGVMLYQMLTGTLPFQGENKLDVLYKTVRERPPPPRERTPHYDIPVEVDALVMTAMATDPRQRFAGVAEMIAAIRGTLQPFRPATLPPPEGGRSGGILVTGSIVELGAPAVPHDHAATVPRLQPPRRVSVVVQPREGDMMTPPAPGEPTLQQAGQPTTLAEPPAVQEGASRGELVAVIAMLIGLVALLALLIHEFAGDPAPAKPSPGRSPWPKASKQAP